MVLSISDGCSNDVDNHFSEALDSQWGEEKIGMNVTLTQKEIDFLNQPHLAAFASINKDGYGERFSRVVYS